LDDGSGEISMTGKQLLKNADSQEFFRRLEETLRKAGFDGGANKKVTFEDWKKYQRQLWPGRPERMHTREDWETDNKIYRFYSSVAAESPRQEPLRDVFVRATDPYPYFESWSDGKEKEWRLSVEALGDIRVRRYDMRVNEGDELVEDDRAGYVNYGNYLSVSVSAAPDAKDPDRDLRITVSQGYGYLGQDCATFSNASERTLEKVWPAPVYAAFTGPAPAQEKTADFSWNDRQQALDEINRWVLVQGAGAAPATEQEAGDPAARARTKLQDDMRSRKGRHKLGPGSTHPR
jgi:hypothetical protein